MALAIKIEVNTPANADVAHRFRNLGESVYLALRDICSVSIEEIDRATTSFVVREIKPRDIPAVTQAIKIELRKHHFDESVTVTRLRGGQD